MITKDTVKDIMQPLIDKHQRIMRFVDIYSYLAPAFGIVYYIINIRDQSPLWLQLTIMLFYILYPIAIFAIGLIPVHSSFPTYKSPYRYIPFYNICLLGFYWLFTFLNMVGNPFFPGRAIVLSIAVLALAIPGYLRYQRHRNHIGEIVDIVMNALDTSPLSEEQIANVKCNVLKWIEIHY